ncbi:MAG: carboxypeptidase-like regulatory domain-containing protein, partial [Bacteroidia bacterium]|nr:carboxypeptidase-like regulatory domain-containing protein [Bacteroidia bacterium]
MIRGKVVDKKTRQPVVAANLVLPDGTGAYSMEEGRFSLKVSSFPVKIRISHIAYGTTEIALNFAPKQELVIELEELVGEIGEVQITAKRLRILTENDDFSIQDFAFDKDNLWLLGYTNNQGSKGKLWLANWFGDTISSVPVRSAESLFRDVFSTVHLVLKDSVYQLYARRGKIELPYSSDREEFFGLMEPILAGFAKKLVYRDINLFEQQATIYYRDLTSKGPHLLTVITYRLG